MYDQASTLRKVAENQGIYNPRDDKRFQGRYGTAKSIAITSGKGGVGKSSIAINIGLAFAGINRKALLLDADLNLANIDILLGISPKRSLHDLLDENVRLEDIVISDKKTGFSIIPGSSGAVELLGENHEVKNNIISRLSRFERKYNYIFIDTAAGIDKSVMDFLVASEDMLVIVTPDPTSITDAYALIKVASMEKQFRKIYVLVNQTDSKRQAREVYDKIYSAVRKFLKFRIFPAGYVFRDKKMIESVRLQRPVIKAYPDSPASLCIKTVAKNLINDMEGTWDEREDDLSYFDKLKSCFIFNKYKDNVGYFKN